MSLTLPLAFWNGPPNLTFTSILLNEDATRLITGSHTGPICVWQITEPKDNNDSESSEGNKDEPVTDKDKGTSPKLKLSPTCVLLGHDAAVTALAYGRFEMTDVVVSASIDGTLAVWDQSDGRCLLSNRELVKGPMTMATLVGGRYVAVAGRTTNISIVDVKRLTVVSVLSGHQDWVMSLYVADMLPTPSLVSISSDGQLRYWTLTSSMERFETSVRSKNLQVLRPLHVSLSANLVYVLVVSIERWVLLTANELEPVFSVPSPVDSEWEGGEFVGRNRVIVWTKDGDTCMYDIPHLANLSPLTLDVGAATVLTPASPKALNDPVGDQVAAAASNPFEADGPVNEWLIVDTDFGLVQYNKSRASTPGLGKGDDGGDDNDDAIGTDAELPTLVCYFVQQSGRTNLVHRPSTPSVTGSPVASPKPSPKPIFKEGVPKLAGSPGPMSAAGFSPAFAGNPSDKLKELAARLRGRPRVIHSRKYGPLPHHHPPLTTCRNGLLATCDWDGMVTLWRTSGIKKPSTSTSTSNGGGAPPSTPSLGSDFHVIRPIASAELSDGWQITDDPSMNGDDTAMLTAARNEAAQVTATAAIADENLPLELVLGMADGRIRIASLPHGADERTAQGHTGPVRALLVTNHDPFLVSAGDDGKVVVWDPFTVTELVTFRHHVMPVRSLFQPSADTPQKLFCSVGLDGNIAVYSVRPLECVRVLGGHTSPVTSIYWRLNGGYLLAALLDGSVVAWDINSGRKESHADLNAAHMMVDRCAASGPMASFKRRAKVPDGVCSHVRKPTPPPSIEAMSVAMGTNDPPVQVLILNTKVIIGSLARQRAGRPRTRSTVAPNSGLADETPSQPGTALVSDSPRGSSPRTPQAVASPGGSGGGGASSVPPLYAVFTYLVPWGYDDQLDNLCRDELGLLPPNPPVAYGVRGHAQAFSVFVPAAVSGLRRWQCSPQMTAIHSVAAVALSKSLMYLADHQNLCSQLSAHYIAIMPERLPKYCEPSIPLLARYWQDPIADIQESTRMLFEGSLLRLSDEERQSLVNFWSSRLKGHGVADAADLSGITGIAVLVIAIVGCDHPEYVDPGVAAAVTVALSRVLRSCSTQRSIAAELLGTGFPLWRYYIKDIPQLLRELFSLAYDADSNPGLLKAARHALVTVGAGEPGMFINAMGELALRTGLAPREHAAALNAISQLIKKSPVALLPYIPQLIEAITRVLDPNNAELRNSVLPACTSILHEIVKRFPMVSFHQERQLLAVGTHDASILIYDLRTATKRRALEGIGSPITALCFSYDGQHLVSYTAKEGLVKVWKTDFNRFMSKLGWAGKALKQGHVQPMPKGIQGNALLTSVRIEWISPTTVLIKNSREEKMLTML